MSIKDIFFYIIIRPLEIIFEFIMELSLSATNSIGISILILSLTVNLLVLPLYNRADYIQREENKKRKKIEPWEKHIKKSFKGEERFLVLQTLYRQNDYMPYQSMNNIIPLLLEIPFFIAAYHFLTSMVNIQEETFGFIKDMGVPDGLISIFGMKLNLFPIAMTLVNIISSYIYSKDLSKFNKIQMYAIALVFFFFLYDSPAALTFYWMLNNIFSLVKNIVYVLREKNNKENRKLEKNDKIAIKNKKTLLFVLASIFNVLLVGLYVPMNVIKPAVGDFLDVTEMRNPLEIVINNGLVFFGIFVFWMGMIYYLSNTKGKNIIAGIQLVLALIFVFNYTIVDDSSRLNKYLVYESFPEFKLVDNLQSGAFIFGIIILCCFGLKKNYKFFIYILSVGFIGLLVLNSIGFYKIDKEYSYYSEMLNRNTDIPEFKLSKNGKNVVVIMMDAMVSQYIPYFLNEKPELTDALEGFTYYPNCISYGRCTNTGSPGLYGGYEYTPEEMNKRTGESLKDKQNEALKVMPVLFDNNGYKVTVSDPTYANYTWIPDLSIYDEYPNIKTFISKGRLTQEKDSKFIFDSVSYNMMYFSFMKISPVFFRKAIYNGGVYHRLVYGMGIGFQRYINKHETVGIYDDSYDAYCMLYNLPNITTVEDESYNSFTMMSNDLTHDLMLFQEPDYLPALYVDNTDYDKNHAIRNDIYGNKLNIFDDKCEDKESLEYVRHYEGNMAALINLARWFDYLRTEGVYDNTRIIIVSDHGSAVNLDSKFIYICYDDKGKASLTDLYNLQSTLLVKDFNSHEFTINNDFMSNADVPTLAVSGLIDYPTNPFTGKAITSEGKKEGKNMLSATRNWSTSYNNGNTFMPEHWFSVHDNIFDLNNWEYEGYH